ncbi:helix-turn-helix domain-containing protein [Listeria monocytogenes]|uniref:helix-turn-helix domain-containing protein n=1 Tax=Listeria marthii TaxID=529731 RepID=UPI0027F55E98|nr:helix-turn-helix domain-containing protein [Listeria marthii]EIT7385943.1 helix-turn-helix domain-containing protein [Listeria monocytogenes]EKZ0262857.1 helix-turn-helix domain-containing protein [Listeria monocytogenes]MDT0090722.1 helix-turn-helix domain-containing protein [Listeria marthii]
MQKIGTTLKKVRMAQNLTQKDIIGNDLPRSTLEKIENGTRNPSYDKITLICEKLNTSLAEVIYIHNDYKLTKKETLIHDFKNLRHSLLPKPIETLLLDLDKYLLTHEDRQIVELKAVLEAMVIFNNTQKFSDALETVEFIWERLEKLDVWLEFDILILSHLFFIFEVETAKHIINRLLVQIKKYSLYRHHYRLEMGLMINIATFFRHSYEILEAEPFINKGIELAKRNENTIVELIGKYKKTEILYVKGFESEATKEYQHIVSILKMLDKEYIYCDMENDWNELTLNIKKYRK